MWTMRAVAACVVTLAACVITLAACAGSESYGSLPPPRATDGSAGSAPAATRPAKTDLAAPGPAGTSPAAATPAMSGGATPGPVEAEVVAQYRRFWVDALPAAAAAPPARRSAILAPVTAEPQLSHLVRSLASLDARGHRDYGADVPVRQTVRVSGGLALVDGCLDSSHSGVADAATGAPVTRGVPRNPVRADLTRGHDGVWRVCAVAYPPDTTC